MKSLFTVVLFVVSALSFGQTNLTGKTLSVDEATKIQNMSIHVEVDSAEEVASTFKTADIESLFDEVEEGQDISFKITCNGEKMSNGVKSHMSYAVKGNTTDKKSFLLSVKKMRKAAINYYKNKE